MKTLKNYLAILKESYLPFAKPAVVLFLLLATGQALFLSIPYLNGKIIDNLSTKAPFQDSLILGGMIFFVYITSSVIGYVRERYEISRIDYALPKFTNTETLKKLFLFSLGQHINEHSGLRQSVISRGTNALQQFLNGFVYSLLPFLLQIILATVAIFFVNPLLGGIVFSVSTIYLVLTFRYNVRFYPEMAKNRDHWNKQQKHFTEILRNVKLVKVTAKENKMVDIYREFFDTIAIPTQKMWGQYVNAYYSWSSIVSLGQVGALLVGVWLVTVGVETPGKIVSLIGWMGSVFGNVGNLGWIQRQMLLQLADISKFKEILSRESAVKDATNPVTLNKIIGKIEFRNVSFAYPYLASIEGNEENGGNGEEDETSKEILRHVSFVISPGETVAIVGHSGAGKTTIVNLLLRGYDPDEGEILVDDIDLRQVAQRSFLGAVGYVPQHVELFDNTLKYNLVFAVRDDVTVTESELEEISKKSRIDQFYDRLGEKRFETMIGEGGIKLSGGERQRVGIARAMLKHPEILIFDEATSSLDAENEALIHEAMREALMGRTGIIIAHRLSTIRDAHKIIVMDSGEVAGIGTHDELMQTCEVYKKLIDRQMVV